MFAAWEDTTSTAGSSPLLPGFLRSQSTIADRISSGLVGGSGLGAVEAGAELLPLEAETAGDSAGGGGGAGSSGGGAEVGALGLADSPGMNAVNTGEGTVKQLLHKRPCACCCRCSSLPASRLALVSALTWREGCRGFL